MGSTHRWSSIAGATCVAVALALPVSAQEARLSLEPDTDRPGQDYRSFDLGKGTAEQCRAACAAEARCQGYTFVRPGVQGPGARCWLKATAGPARPNSCCTSGARVASAPPPGGPLPILPIAIGSAADRPFANANFEAPLAEGSWRTLFFGPPKPVQERQRKCWSETAAANIRVNGAPLVPLGGNYWHVPVAADFGQEGSCWLETLKGIPFESPPFEVRERYLHLRARALSIRNAIEIRDKHDRVLVRRELTPSRVMNRHLFDLAQFRGQGVKIVLTTAFNAPSSMEVDDIQVSSGPPPAIALPTAEELPRMGPDSPNSTPTRWPTSPWAV